MWGVTTGNSPSPAGTLLGMSGPGPDDYDPAGVDPLTVTRRIRDASYTCPYMSVVRILIR